MATNAALCTSTDAFFLTLDEGKSIRVLVNIKVTAGTYNAGGEDLSAILADERIKVGSAPLQRGTPFSIYAQGNKGNSWSVSQTPAAASGILKLQLWTSTPGTEFSGAYGAAQTGDVIRLDVSFPKYGAMARIAGGF